jgi:hypothetical protein
VHRVIARSSAAIGYLFSDPNCASCPHTKLRLMTVLLPPTAQICPFNPAIFDLTRDPNLAGIWVTRPEYLQTVKRLLM